jgi:hypothetical protein
MIVRDHGSELVLVTQPDHARFAGELMGLWREAPLVDHRRRDDLLFAVREHDNGWRETDAAPLCDPERGRPHDFLSIPAAERAAIWSRGTRRFEERRPYAALLITLHALAVDPAPPGGAGGDGELRAELVERRDRLLAAAGVRRREAARDRRLLDLADLLSLAACSGWRDPQERHGVRARFDPEIHTLCLDPFPLAGATTFRVPCRRLPARRYAGDADLGGELAAARWQELAIRVVPIRSEEHLRGAAAAF